VTARLRDVAPESLEGRITGARSGQVQPQRLRILVPSPATGAHPRAGALAISPYSSSSQGRVGGERRCEDLCLRIQVASLEEEDILGPRNLLGHGARP